MRITAIRDETVSIRSEIRNAFISFSEMTVSAVAIVTDVVRDGKRVVGYGFNSNGRYAQSGILRERMIPRLLKAPPESLLDDERENFDPFKAWQVMMTNEKPGGHGERSVAVGTLDMALWDLVAKIEGKPVYCVLAERYGDGTGHRGEPLLASRFPQSDPLRRSRNRLRRRKTLLLCSATSRSAVVEWAVPV